LPSGHATGGKTTSRRQRDCDDHYRDEHRALKFDMRQIAHRPSFAAAYDANGRNVGSVTTTRTQSR
jgi:hypothetical protein